MRNLIETVTRLTESMTVYHGSQQDVPHFKYGHVGTNSNVLGSWNTTRYGVFFTDNPDYAAMYGKVGRYTIAVSNTLDLDDDGNTVWNFCQSLDAHDPDQRDIWLAVRNVVRGSPVWHLFDSEVGEVFTRYLIELGYDSATYEEFAEDDSGQEHKSQTVVVFDPAKISLADQPSN